ncbi:hypothetical protein ACFVJH_26695 [Streptomyces decoyicus]|uniref:hypothetical protein n=1 Tax=Streptomyces decoyicus TaxID=249567 RepID=UPI003625E934
MHNGVDDRLASLLGVDCSGEFCDSVYREVSVACGCEEMHGTLLPDSTTALLTELTVFPGFELECAFSLLADQLTSWLKDENCLSPAY